MMLHRRKKYSAFASLKHKNDSPKKRKRHEELAGDFAGDLAGDIVAKVLCYCSKIQTRRRLRRRLAGTSPETLQQNNYTKVAKPKNN
jgi:hypothetical protein